MEGENKRSINFLSNVMSKDIDTIVKCIHETSKIYEESFTAVLNIITYDWIRKTLRIWPRCYSCGLPKQNYNFPCRLAHTVFLDYQELKQKSPSKYISITQRLRQERKEFEKEKKELEEKLRKPPRVRFNIPST